MIIGFVFLSLATYALAQSAGGLAPTTANQGSNLQHWIGVDLVKLIINADMLGKISLVFLAFMSIASWSIIIYKFLHIRQAIKQTDAFVDICNQGTGDLDEAFRQANQFPDSPLAQILREGYMELEIENWYRDGYELSSEARFELAKVGIERIFERTISNELTHLESKLVFLATTTNVCPFVGLFGTVWGVMVAFQAMTNANTASLSALAPGIATALLCTVGGLFCAIPAAVFYNFLTHNIRKLTSRMDAFALELSNVIQKQIIKQSAGTGVASR
jgi:biopolymer transport protein TolQ